LSTVPTSTPAGSSCRRRRTCARCTARRRARLITQRLERRRSHARDLRLGWSLRSCSSVVIGTPPSRTIWSRRLPATLSRSPRGSGSGRAGRTRRSQRLGGGAVEVPSRRGLASTENQRGAVEVLPSDSARARARSRPIPGTASHSSGDAATTAATVPNRSSSARAPVVEIPGTDASSASATSVPPAFGRCRSRGRVHPRRSEAAAHASVPSA